MNYLRVQLKVCEGCGNLWFRTQMEGNYGQCCARRLAEHARAATAVRRKRRTKVALVTERGTA